ncbi:MAG TPA: Rrf2 family transcriptional regulator [Burkholderiales bacterium]
MILSRTSQYAVQALIYMTTQPAGTAVLNRGIASYLRVPPAYLAKILRQLSKAGLLQSARGRQGGFVLEPGAEKTYLLQVVSLIEGPGFAEDCVLGLKVCEERTACPMHAQWKPVKERIVAMLREQTLESLAKAVRSGRYRIADLPQAVLENTAGHPAAAA